MIKKEVFIVSAARTPIGSFGGVLANISSTDLGACAIKGAIVKAQVDPALVDEVFMGNVCSANLGQAPARQAALSAGIPNTTPCTTINKVCSSGTKSIIFGAQNILLGQSDIVISGGMESMSNVPYYIPKARFGYKYGNSNLIDGLHKDGLLDPYDRESMGVFADKTAEKYNISREEQDDYAIRSYKKSNTSNEGGVFTKEIVSVEVPQRKGKTILVDQDEEYKNVKYEKIKNLNAAFSKNGTATAANSSSINDGASALILASSFAIDKYKLKPIAKIISFADAAHEPKWFTTAPTKSTLKALESININLSEIDYFEVNEAFSVVPLVFSKILKVNLNKVNIHGGAVSIGHPLGASGARIVTSLINVLKTNGGKIGCAAICNGGGGASSIIIELV